MCFALESRYSRNVGSIFLYSESFGVKLIKQIVYNPLFISAFNYVIICFC
jgi:hypothetical protein